MHQLAKFNLCLFSMDVLKVSQKKEKHLESKYLPR